MLKSFEPGSFADNGRDKPPSPRIVEAAAWSLPLQTNHRYPSRGAFRTAEPVHPAYG